MTEDKDYKKISVILSVILAVALVLLAATAFFVLRFREDLPVLEALAYVRAFGFYYDEDRSKELTEAVLHELPDVLEKDDYSAYYSAEEYRELTEEESGRYVGIGVRIEAPDDIGAALTEVYDGGAMAKAGCVAGDIVVSIDGFQTAGRTLEEVLACFDFSVERSYSLTILREGKMFDVSVSAGEVYVPYVESRLIGDGIGYIRISAFYGDASKETEKALNDLLDNGIKALMIDLRNDPGGNLNIVLEIARLFMKEGELITEVRSRLNDTVCYYSEGEGVDIPLTVLVNGGSASGSELLAGALRDNGRAVVIGTKTYGKGIVQSIFRMHTTGGRIKFTTDAYYTPSGVCIQDVGITPDIVIEESSKLSEDRKTDAVLDAAVDYLQKIIN